MGATARVLALFLDQAVQKVLGRHFRKAGGNFVDWMCQMVSV
jgi:hypothetical protein